MANKINRAKYFSQTNGRCGYCGQKIDIETMHLDHMLPRSKGGKTPNNLIASCPECNLSKGDLDVEEFRNKLENIIYDSFKGRMIRKYYHLRPRTIQFYFEKENLLEEKNERQFSYEKRMGAYVTSSSK